MKYFAYDPSGNGFTFHETAKQAQQEASKAFDWEQGQACEGWSEDVADICWGKIAERVTETGRAECHTGEFDELVTYELKKIGEDLVYRAALERTAQDDG